MNGLVICLSFFASIGQAAAVALPNQTLTFHSVLFSDPQGNTVVGGNAYDRQMNEIGVNKNQTNTALATVTPARVTSLVQFVSAAANTATVAQTQTAPAQQLLTVTGANRGQTSVFPQRAPIAQLGVFVFTPFQRTLAIHIINDNAGNNAGITVAQAQAALATANATWGNQANITFGPNVQINTVTVPQNLGTALDLQSASISTEEQAVIDAAKNSAVAINIYIVNSVNIVGGAPVDGATRDATADIYVAATSPTFNRTLAHELGHALGLNLNNGNADYTDAPRQYQLMWGINTRGATVPPQQGDFINPVN